MESLTVAEQLGMIFATRVKPEEWAFNEKNKRLVEVCLPPVVDETVKILAGEGSIAEMESVVTQMLIGMGATMLVVETSKRLDKRLKQREEENELQGRRMDDSPGGEEPTVCGGTKKCEGCKKGD